MPDPDPEQDFDPNGPMDDGNPLGTLGGRAHLAVDVSPYLDHKRRALGGARQPGHRHRHDAVDAARRCSIAFFGTEWFIEPGSDAPLHGGWLLDAADPR